MSVQPSNSSPRLYLRVTSIFDASHGRSAKNLASGDAKAGPRPSGFQENNKKKNIYTHKTRSYDTNSFTINATFQKSRSNLVKYTRFCEPKRPQFNPKSPLYARPERLWHAALEIGRGGTAGV